MPSPDLDLAELYVTIRNWSTLLPYVDTQNGRTTQNMPYEAVEITDVMYEANANSKSITPSSAKITLPSLYDQYELRTLFQSIQFGDRVEIFNFQPDCGDPIFAGYIPSEGITQDAGKLSLDVQDPFVRGKWQHIKKIEQFSDSVATLYTRGLSQWTDVINEDFSQNVNYSTYYTISDNYTGNHGSHTISPATGLQVSGSTDADGTPGNTTLQLKTAQQVTFSAGDTWLLEADITLSYDFHALVSLPGNGPSLQFEFLQPSGQFLMEYNESFQGITYPVTGLAASVVTSTAMTGSDGVTPNNPWVTSNSLLLGTSTTHRYQMLVRINAAGQGVFTVFRDQVPIVTSASMKATGTGITPLLVLSIIGLTATASCTMFRVRKLISYLDKSSRFKPQSSDVIFYQANNEEAADFFALWMQKDLTEYRINYRASPQRDTVDLDLAGTLGTNVSQTLGYEQIPVKLGAGVISVDTDQATFLNAPPFRFEEGYNMVSAPKKDSKALAYSNSLVLSGSGTQDAQVFSEVWSIAEVGNPVQGIAAKYPYMEIVSNNDKVSLLTVAKQIANGELSQHIDKTPSLTVQVAPDLLYTGRWRAGDTVRVVTRALLTNLEQDMRIMSIRHSAGSPLREVVLGHPAFDYNMQQRLQEDMLQSWLYDLSGSTSLTFVYPFTSVALTGGGASSTAFQLPVDSYTAASVVVQAFLHFYTAQGGQANNVQALVGGNTVQSSSATYDSGLIDITPMLQGFGPVVLQFKAPSVTTTLANAFITMRIRV